MLGLAVPGEPEDMRIRQDRSDRVTPIQKGAVIAPRRDGQGRLFIEADQPVAGPVQRFELRGPARSRWPSQVASVRNAPVIQSWWNGSASRGTASCRSSD